METQYGSSEPTQSDTSGRSSLLLAGGAGVVGGLTLTVSAMMQAVQPPGCIASECVDRTYRIAGPLEAFLFLAGILLIAVATLGLHSVLPKGARGANLVKICAVSAFATFSGVALLGSALYYVGLAMVVVAILAHTVLGVCVAATRALPAWTGVMLSASALLLFAANDQNERILFVVPFGLTWVVLGTALWLSASSAKGRSGRVQLA